MIRDAAEARASASGTATVRLAPVRVGQALDVARLTVETFGSTAEPEVNVYRSGQLVDGTYTGTRDVSELAAGTLVLLPGEQLEARWTGADSGAQCRFTMDAR